MTSKNKEQSKKKPGIVDAPEAARQAGVSAAPEPISATGSGSRADNIKDPASMTRAEYEAWRKRGGGGTSNW